MKNFPKTLFILCAAGLSLRLLFFVLILLTQGSEAFLVSDSSGFLNIAHNLLMGNGFSQSSEAPFLPSAHFPPFYPLMLAGSLGLFSSILPLIFVQLILSSTMPILVWLIATRFTQRTDTPLIAAGFMALEPVLGIFGLLALTDTFAVFFLLMAFLFFLRVLQEQSQTRDGILAGLFSGASVLTKPNAQFVFFLLLLALAFAWWFKKIVTARAATAFALAFFLVLSPWLARNMVQFGSASVSATGLRNLYTDFAVSVLSYETGRSYGEIEDELRRAFAKERGISLSEIQENPALGKELAREGIDIIVSHPRSSAAVLAITLQAFFTQDLWAYFAQKFHLIQPTTFDFSPSVVLFKEGPAALASRVWELLGISALIPLAGRLVWVLLTIFALFGFTKALRSPKERMTALLMAVMILYYAATSAVAAFSDQGRHRYPADAFIMILAAYGISRVTELRKPQSTFGKPLS